MSSEEIDDCADVTFSEIAHQRALAEALSSRNDDIVKWTSKLREELKQNISQFHELYELKDRLETMFRGIEEPFAISKENQRIFKAHRGSEVGRDVAEEALLREANIFKRRHKMLLKERQRINSQLEHLRDLRRDIEADIQNKMEVKEMAECIMVLAKLPKDIGPLPMHRRIPLDMTPSAWLKYSATIIDKSRMERNFAQFLSIDVTRDMLGVANECFGIWYSTNAALKKRIQSSHEAKSHVQRHQRKLEQDIAALRSSADEVLSTLVAKKALLKAAQDSVDARKGVSGLAFCRDSEMMELFKEIQAHRSVIEALTPKYAEMEETLERLNQTKKKLDRDLGLKVMAIRDKEKCLFLRQSCPISTFQGARSARLLSAFLEK